MLWTLMWLAGVFLGYAIFMSQTPLRGYFSDAFGLVRERGSAHLWLLAGLLTMAGAALDLWRHFDAGAAFGWGSVLLAPDLQAAASDIPVRASRLLGDLFSTVVGGGANPVGGGARGVMVAILGSLLFVAAALVLQYYILLLLYVRISNPARRIPPAKLFELALRRFGRTWPLLIACWFVWALPLIEGVPDVVRLWSGGAMATGFVVFAFLQVAVLSGERDLAAAVSFNFECWKNGALAGGWFMVVALVNLCVFQLAEVSVERAISPTSFPGIALKIAFVFGRCFVLVWLLAAWLLLFCDRLIGPKRPRPK